MRATTNEGPGSPGGARVDCGADRPKLFGQPACAACAAQQSEVVGTGQCRAVTRVHNPLVRWTLGTIGLPDSGQAVAALADARRRLRMN